MNVMIIALAGGSGSGKTTFAKLLKKKLGEDLCSILGQDSYYFDQSSKFDKDGGSVNFDHPSALDFELMAKHLRDLSLNLTINVPIYDFATHKRQINGDVMRPTPFILVDGTLILSQEILRPLFDYKVFIDVNEETRFARRLKRDMEERGRSAEGVKEQFFKQVVPMHDTYVAQSLSFADMVVSTDNFEQKLSELISLIKKD